MSENSDVRLVGEFNSERGSSPNTQSLSIVTINQYGVCAWCQCVRVRERERGKKTPFKKIITNGKPKRYFRSGI